MTQYIQRLPAVFQTVTEKQFFDATFDQVFSKKDSDFLAGYLGRRNPGSYNPINDFYLPEPSKNRTWWQLEATAYARTEENTKSNIFFYEDLLDRINYYGGNTLNQDRLFQSEYYSFGPPIDYDMFINYQNYYWIEQGLPTIEISGVLASDIIGETSYTTPITATPAELTLLTGMTILLVDDPDNTSPLVVENMGGCGIQSGIQLIPIFPDFTAGTILEFLPWDGIIQQSNGIVLNNEYWDGNTWDTQAQPTSGDYITIERGSLDRNVWSRTNKWFNIQAINKTIEITGGSFPLNSIRALRPIIQFIANLNLYKSGTQFKQEITYGFRNNSFGNPLLLSQLQNRPQILLNNTYDIDLTDGTLVCFFNDNTPFVANYFPWDSGVTDPWDAYPTPVVDEWDSGTATSVNRYIYTTNVLPDGNVIFTPYTSYETPVLDGDIVLIDQDAPYDGAQRGQTWYFESGTWYQAFNDKISINQPPLFQLYDHDGIKLDDPVKYPSSTFEGSEIFSYKVNSTPGATIDPVLGFPIVYTALGQSSDIIFQNDLITERYTYGAFLPINGYYYYKSSTSPVLYNNWNLYDPCDCDNIVLIPPYNCVETSKQRVINQYVVGYGTLYQFRLSVTPYGYPSLNTDLIVSVNGIEVKNASIQANGYVLVEINNKIYVDLTAYLTTLFLTTQAIPPVVEVQTYTHDLLDPASPGYFQIPQQLEANPTQQEVTEISGSNLIQQFSSIIENQLGFEGIAFGGKNNYQDSRKNRSLGSYILQNVAPALKSMLVSSSDDLDFIAGVRFSQDEYTKFKNKYLTVAKQFINQEFNPVQYNNNTISVVTWVSEIIKTINVSKEFSNAFAYSFMAATGTPTFSEVKNVPGNSLVTLSNYIDLNDPKNLLYIYDATVPTNHTMLIVGRDYEVISDNLAIDIQLKLSATPNRTLIFYLYKNPLPTYIPSTPTKVGAYGAYIPRIELDTSYAIPTNVIIGHDGSKTITYGDYRDQLLLELEARIYNGIQNKFRNEYYLPLRVESVQSGYFRNTRYSRDEYLGITESYLNKWSAKNKANYRANDWATASLDTPVSKLWKLYNYRNATNANGNALNLPGNWKGIFQYCYDTYYPDTRPWEMLGLSQQPNWWVEEYGNPVLNLAGQKVWTSTSAGLHDMWDDLEAGIIRQGPSALYDPITQLPVPQEMWARPGLSIIIPVDSAGEIRSVMTIFNVVYSGNPYEPFDGFDEEWVYGDGSPVEQAWMSTSAYRYSLQEFMYLMRPGPFGELLWDTLGTSLSPGMLIDVPDIENPVRSNTNWQYVQNDTFSNADPFFAWMRPKNKDQIVHAETIDTVVQVRFGYQCWISDRILFLGKNVGSVFGQKVRTLDVNLANKFAGFTNKDTTNTYIEGITPGVSANTLIIPTTNFEVVLHKSSPVNTYAYSGVIIRALAQGTFAVYGYDLLNSTFTTLDRSNDKLIDVTVGGTPAEFQYFTSGATYNQGDIVRYNGVYYESNVTQTAQSFVSSNWTKLKALPIVGGVSVTYKPVSSSTITNVPYGTIFKNPQQVFDFLIGWGAWLETQGWQFQNVDSDTNQISDWQSSAKQFLFWLNTSWAPDASIQLSPLANSATLKVKRGYPDDVETMSNGVYNILDKYGVSIAPNNTTVERSGPSVTVSPSNLSSGGIYFLQISASETEHILIFDNVTNFNDTVYDPLLRARQQRLRFNGFRSNGWYGKMEAPGYLVIDNQLVPNYDTIVNSMRYFYDSNITIDNPSLEDLGRHLIGYESKSYLDNLQVSNDVQYLFYKGAIRQKGTKQAFDKLFRSTKIQSDEVIEVFEEWALKLGNFGNTIEQVSTEFILRPEQNSGEVIVARLNFIPSNIGFVREINILNAENTYLVVPKILISAPDADPASLPVGKTLVQATAYAVLGAGNVISRVDIVNPGYGYLTAPIVYIDSGSEPNNLDVLYSVWQGEIVKDVNIDNIVEIDIDQTDTWLVRPIDPTYSLEFPVTDNIEYSIPNAGYVNFNDVTYSRFDINQTVVTWGNGQFNPVNGNTVWVANTFTGDWGVYKLVDVAPNPFDVIVGDAGNLLLRTSSSFTITPQFSTAGEITDLGNLIVLQVHGANAAVEPAAIVSGAITEVKLTQAGAGYNSVPNVTIVGDGYGATAMAEIAAGSVSNITVTNQGTGYTSASVIVDPPNRISGDSNYALGFTFSQIDTDIWNSQNLTNQKNYYNLVTLAGTPVMATDIPEYADFTNLLLFKTMRWLTTPVEPSLPVYVGLGDKIWVDDVGGKWTVFNIQADPGKWDYDGIMYWDQAVVDFWSVPVYPYPAEDSYGWDVTGPMYFNPFRIQQPLINTSLFQSASVFNNRGTELVQMPVFDPFKAILPGIARQNITYTTFTDPATYNVTGDPTLFSENITFSDRQVGQLWWDLSSTRYVYYEQPTALDGSETETDNLIYRRNHWGKIFPGSAIAVYEWVRSQVPPSNYTGTGTPKDVTSYVQLNSLNNFTNIIETNYYFWVLGATDLPNIQNRTLPALDVSLLLQSPKSRGFYFFSPIQQTPTNNSYMFYNVQNILSYQGDNVQIQYRVAERDDQKHAQWAFFREGDKNSLVTDQFWNKMVDSICAYTGILPVTDEFQDGILIAKNLPWDIYGWDISPWDDATSTTVPEYGQVLPVPDPTLSRVEKYGVLYRPRQGMFANLTAARKVFVQAANELLKYIPIRDDDPSWDAYVQTSIYWMYTTWYAVGYEDAVPTVVYPTLISANTALLAGQLQVGQILQVTSGTVDGRYVLYVVTQPNPNVTVLSLEEVAIENSAIKLLDTIYTVDNKYGLSAELRELLNAFRTTVMINNYVVDQNELFFSMLNYVLSEKRNPDWVFKSSYIYIKENNLPLNQSKLYQPDQISNIIDYITDSKPYHTQVRDYTAAYLTTDVADGTAIDTMAGKFTLQFGPGYSLGYPVITDNNNLDAIYGWDLNQGPFTEPWETFDWDMLATINTVLGQFVSGNNVPADFEPAPGNPWPNLYTVSLTIFDPSKVGYSKLFPYTFNFNSLNINNPQSFITPYNIVAVQIGTNILRYGYDYYVEYNSDSTYTVYFYNNPGSLITPVALVWFDGGSLLTMNSYTPRAEIANGYAEDDMVVNVDTKLAVNNYQGILRPFSDMWDRTDTVITDIVVTAGGQPVGFGNSFWDQNTTTYAEILENTISFKENTNRKDGAEFYRNAEIYSGVLVENLPAPAELTENLQIITVFVDPTTHPDGTDILPDPIGNIPAVWIGGERIEYRIKEYISPNTWALRSIRRGTKGTGIVDHPALIPSLEDPLVLVPNPVWVENNNIMPAGCNETVWNAVDPSPDESTEDLFYLWDVGPWDELPWDEGLRYTSVTSVPLGGLWYALTPEATYLKNNQGISIP